MPGLQGPDRVGPQGRPERAPTCASRFRPLLQEVGVGRPLRGRGGPRLEGPSRFDAGAGIEEDPGAFRAPSRRTPGGPHAPRAGTGSRNQTTRGAPGHPGPSRRALSSRQVFLDPSVALNGSALRARILSSRAASEIDLLEGGRDRAAQVKWTGPVLHPGPVRTVQTRHGPRSSSLALVDAVGGSARRALTLRRYRQADALRPIAPSRLSSRTPRRRLLDAPGPLGGGAGPVPGDRPEPPGGSRPRRVPGPAPSPLRPRTANTPRPVRDGQGAPTSTGSHVV